jgi:hypothetical protein
MGYNTDFDGEVTIEPPLSEKEIKYINMFADTRRMNRKNGPYYVGGTGMCGQDNESDVIDYNSPDDSQPGLWCKWETNEEGNVIRWNGCEKFYDATEWMRYIIDHFIGENPLAKLNDPEHFDFLQGHTLNGEIYADGEESGDNWMIEVTDGVVTEKQGTVSYD